MNNKIKRVVFVLAIMVLVFGTGTIIKIGKFSKLEGYMYSLAASLTNTATSCNATSSNATNCNATSSNATSCNATSSNATSCNATSSNATSCNATSSNSTSCNATSSNAANNKKPTSTIKVTNTNNNKTENVEDNVATAPVEEEKEGDLEYNSSKITKEVLNEITSSKDTQNVIINLDGHLTISKDVFEAIKGKQKQLTINSGIHQIVFNGKDIETTKDIDAKITYNLINEDADLKEINKNGIVINFADNGNLPGIATVRIKATDEIKNVLKMEDIYVYYYDEANKELTKLSNNAKYSNNGFIEFSISHNSKYVFINEEIKSDSNGYVESTVGAENDNEVTFLGSYMVYILIIAVSILVIIVVTVIVIVDRKKNLKNINTPEEVKEESEE